MIIGGIIAAVGFVSEVQVQVITFVAASIIAPGLESVAKIPLGLVLKNKDVLRTGVMAAFIGYLMIILSGALTFFVLLQFSDVEAKQFLENKATIGLLDLKLKDFLLSFVAAAASMLMYLSYRRNVIAGPLIALILIPASTAIGMSIMIGKWSYTWEFIKRLGLDIALVIVVGILLIYAKQKLVHKLKHLL